MISYSIQKILVPIDLSETSLNALETAIGLAKKHNALLQILHVSGSSFDLFSEDSYQLFHKENASDVINALAGKIEYSSGLTPQLLQEEGNVGDIILKTALLQQSDLVVMGTHGASGFRDGFIGSTTYCVMKHAKVPVLSVPPKKKYPGFRNVLFPIRPVTGALTRYDVVSSLIAPQSSMDVLGLSYRRMERETNVLDKVISEIMPGLKSDKIKTSANWGNGESIAEDVLRHAQDTNPDLIILTTVLDVATKSNFIGPHAQRIINCAKVPVLMIKKINVVALAG